MPALPCLHAVELRKTNKDVVKFISVSTKKGYNAKETAALLSTNKFVALKDGESKIVLKLTADKSGVDVTHVEFVPENVIEQASIGKIVIEATDKKTKRKKKAEFNPRAARTSNSLPAPMIFSNLMVLKALQGLNTDEISISVNKIPKMKLGVHLKIKACTKLSTTAKAISTSK